MIVGAVLVVGVVVPGGGAGVVDVVAEVVDVVAGVVLVVVVVPTVVAGVVAWERACFVGRGAFTRAVVR